MPSYKPSMVPTNDPDARVLPGGGMLTWLVCSGCALALLGALVGPQLVNARPLLDELVYRRAFAAAAAGADLHGVDGWFYPDIGAYAGAAACGAFGETWVFRALRLANLLGLALTVGWAAAEGVGADRRAHALRGLLILALVAMPATQTAAIVGNVSGVLMLVLLAALALPAPARAVPLAVSFLLKPYGLALALAQRPVSAVVPLCAAGLAWLGTSNRSGFPNIESIRNNALVRSAHAIGVPVPWQVITAVVLCGALVARPRGPAALAWGWLALPIAWDHTGILAFPALGVALARPPRILGDPRLGRLLAVFTAVVLAYGGLFGADDAPSVVSGALGLVPPLAVACLCFVSYNDDPGGLHARVAPTSGPA